MTARMLAWKQPFIQRVRNSSLVEGPGIDVYKRQPNILVLLITVRSATGWLIPRNFLMALKAC